MAVDELAKSDTFKGQDTSFGYSFLKGKYDIIYICLPSNQAGISYSYNEFKKLVGYAIENEAVILYDNVYNVLLVLNIFLNLFMRLKMLLKE